MNKVKVNKDNDNWPQQKHRFSVVSNKLPENLNQFLCVSNLYTVLSMETQSGIAQEWNHCSPRYIRAWFPGIDMYPGSGSPFHGQLFPTVTSKT